MAKYYKSLIPLKNGSYGTKNTPPDGSLQDFQSLDDMISTGIIHPNTTHSALKDRLCVSQISREYPEVYRPEGIIFETEEVPDYCSPVDLMSLTDGQTYTSGDYASQFLPGSEKLLFKSPEKMKKKFPTAKHAKITLDQLRKDAKVASKKSAGEYAEYCFERPINILPYALIGTSEKIIEYAKSHNLPLFPTAQSYVATLPKDKQTDVLTRSIAGAAFRVASSFAIDAAYTTYKTGSMTSYPENFEWDQAFRIFLAVCAINFVDYKLDITNTIANATKRFKKVAYKGIL